MRRPPALRTLACAALALALGSAPASGKATAVSGRVEGGEGFTILGLQADGTAVSRKLGANGAFKLVFKGTGARGASLNLVAPDGSYFGPIVLRSGKGKAFETLSGGPVSLGAIALRARYAAPVRPAPEAAVDLRRPARAGANGKPVGAGRLGLVKKAAASRRAAAALAAAGRGAAAPSAPAGQAKTLTLVRKPLAVRLASPSPGDVSLYTAQLRLKVRGRGAASAGLPFKLAFREPASVPAGVGVAAIARQVKARRLTTTYALLIAAANRRSAAAERAAQQGAELGGGVQITPRAPMLAEAQAGLSDARAKAPDPRGAFCADAGRAALAGGQLALHDAVLRRGDLGELTPGQFLSSSFGFGGCTDFPVAAGFYGLLDPGQDPDADGVPSVFDVDDNGNGTIDASDPASASAPAGASGQAGSPAFVGPGLIPPFLSETLNLNAGTAVTRETVDAIFQRWFSLFMFFVPLPGISSVNVDCFQLTYCRRGDGTAEILPRNPGFENVDFGTKWLSYDPDGDGLPNLAPNVTVLPGTPKTFHVPVLARATTAQLTFGDTLNFIARGSAGELTVPVTIGSIFVTTPAVATYDDGTGPKAIAYPVPEGGPGNRGNPLPLASGRVALTFWRPQRPVVEGAESGTFIDMGGLNYGALVDLNATDNPPPQFAFCTAADYSGLSATLRPRGSIPPGDPGFTPLQDAAADAAPDPRSRLAFAFDIAGCLRRNGVDPSGRAIIFHLAAADQFETHGFNSFTEQEIAFKLP